MTSRLGKGMSKSFFTVYKRKIITKFYDRLDSTKSMGERTRLLKFFIHERRNLQNSPPLPEKKKFLGTFCVSSL